MNQGTLQYKCMNDFSFLSYPHGIVEACHHVYSHDSYRMHPNALYLRGKISALELGISLIPPRQAPLCRDTWPSSKLLSPSQSNLKMQHQSIRFNHKILKILQVFLTCTDFSTLFLEAGSTDQPPRPLWAPQLVWTGISDQLGPSNAMAETIPTFTWRLRVEDVGVEKEVPKTS